MWLTATWWLCRCCLPNIFNQPAFNNLRDSLPDDVDERVLALVTYINDNWISSRLQPPSPWCAFQSSIRKNDVIGWHNWLNQASRHGKLDLYKLAPLLYKELQYVNVQAVLMSKNRLHCHQKKAHGNGYPVFFGTHEMYNLCCWSDRLTITVYL